MADTMNDTGVTTPEVSGQDAAVQAQTENTALDEFMEQTVAKPADEQTGEQTEPDAQVQDDAPVSKGIRGRIQAAEAKADRAGYDRGKQEASREYEAKIAEYERQLTEYSEIKLTQEAEQLAKEEHCSVTLAKRILRAEKGIAEPAKANTSTVNEAPKNAPQRPAGSMSAERKALLNSQVASLRDNYGIDVFAEGVLTEDEARDIAQGKTDFNTVALRIMSQKGTASRSVPQPVRSGGSREQHGRYDFSTMTDAEIDAFNERIRNGHSYKPR